MGLPLLVEKTVDKIWMTMNWGIYDGYVPLMKALRSIMEDHYVVAEQKCVENGDGPY